MRVVLIALLLFAPAARTYAQSPAAMGQNLADEEIEPRVVGKAGTLLVGFAGYVDKFSSSEDALPAIVTARADVVRFLTKRIAVQGGLVGTGSIGGDSDDLPSGFGAPALFAFGGALFYFTPQSMASLYAGGEYRAQLTNRQESDAGALIAKGGLQGAVSSRVSVFLEGGYGVGLSRGDDDELISRFVGSVGLRVRF